jgi:hypothetical protein
MSPVDLSIAILVAGIGLVLLFVLCFLLFLPFKHILVAQRGQGTLKRASKLLNVVDGLLEKNRALNAVPVLRRAVVFDELMTTSGLIYALQEHNQAILNRCVQISDELNSRTDNLPLVERLMGERIELLHLLQKAVNSYASIREKRGELGKEIPEWSRSDFEQRIRQIREELRANFKNLVTATDELFTSLTKSKKGDDVVYH